MIIANNGLISLYTNIQNIGDSIISICIYSKCYNNFKIYLGNKNYWNWSI